MSFPVPIDTDRASLREKSLLMLISPLRSASTKTTDWSVPTQRLGVSLPRPGSDVQRGGWFDAAWSGPPQGGGLRLAVSWAPCPVPSRVRECWAVSMVSVRKALRVCTSLGTAQMRAGALSCMWHPPNSTFSSWRRPHLCGIQHQGAPGLAGMGMINDAEGSSGLGRPSLLCLQGRRARHFTFPFSTSSLRPVATREQLGKKGPWTPASWSRPPGWFSPAGGTSFLAWGWGSAQVLQGGAARAGRRAGRQQASADLLLLNVSLAAGDPHAADLEDTSAAWYRRPELALPDLLLLKPAAPFLARLRDIGADTCF